MWSSDEWAPHLSQGLKTFNHDLHHQLTKDRGLLYTSFDQRYLQELIIEFINDFKGSWVYFHAFSNKFSCSMRSSVSILWFDIIFKSYVINYTHMWEKRSRDTSLIQGCWPNLASLWFYDHVSISTSKLIILRWLFLLWTLLIILNNFYSQKESNSTRKFIKRCKTLYVTLYIEELGFANF